MPPGTAVLAILQLAFVANFYRNQNFTFGTNNLPVTHGFLLQRIVTIVCLRIGIFPANLDSS